MGAGIARQKGSAMSYCPLDLVEGYLKRFVAYPSEHARVAHVLWIAHTHLMDEWETTPRLAFMSAEPMSGKTRALEVSEHLIHDPLMSFSMSSAVTTRLVAERRRTVLFDEIDGVYGSAKLQESNSELIRFMNAGYRRGAKAYRCATGSGSKHEPIEFEAYAALAVAGLRNLPDALATRAIVIRLRRRAQDEMVEPFRIKFHVPEAKRLGKELADWCAEIAGQLSDNPELPSGIVDRSADIWEPLIAIADVAGDDWPARARAAAVHFTKSNAEDESKSRGVELLEHLRDAFGDDEKLWSETVIERLCAREELPWTDVRGGKPIDKRGLATRLKAYSLKSRDVKINGVNRKGYYLEDCQDAFKRYLPPGSATSATDLTNNNNLVAQVAPVAHRGVGDNDPFAELRDQKYSIQPRRTAI